MPKRRHVIRTAALAAFAVTGFLAERYALPRVGFAAGPIMPIGQVVHVSANARMDGLIGASVALAAGEMTPLDSHTLDKLRPPETATRPAPRPSPAGSDPLRALPAETPCLESNCPKPHPAAAEPDTTGSFLVAAGPEALAVRQSHVFAAVDVIDGRSFRAEGTTIRLANIALPGQRQSCRRIDGIVEPCAERALTRLDLVTRHRPVACDLEPASSADGALTGDCRVGGDDLGLRLIREGWATPLSDTPEAAAAVAEARRLKAGIWQ